MGEHSKVPQKNEITYNTNNGDPWLPFMYKHNNYVYIYIYIYSSYNGHTPEIIMYIYSSYNGHTPDDAFIV